MSKWILVGKNELFCHSEEKPFLANEKWPLEKAIFFCFSSFWWWWMRCIQWTACILATTTIKIITTKNRIQSINSFILRFQLASVIHIEIAGGWLRRICMIGFKRKNVYSIWATYEHWTHAHLTTIIACSKWKRANVNKLNWPHNYSYLMFSIRMVEFRFRFRWNSLCYRIYAHKFICIIHSFYFVSDVLIFLFLLSAFHAIECVAELVCVLENSA